MDDRVKSTTLLATFRASDNIVLISPDIIHAAGRSNLQYNKLKDTIQNGFQKMHSLTAPKIHKYWEVRHYLSVDDGLVLLDQRIVITTSQHAKVLQSLHSVHQEDVGMKACANESVYWLGMNTSIHKTRAGCTYCSRIVPSQPKEPIKFAPSPDWPFQQIVMDLFLGGNHAYLVCADRFKRTHPSPKTTTHTQWGGRRCRIMIALSAIISMQ